MHHLTSLAPSVCIWCPFSTQHPQQYFKMQHNMLLPCLQQHTYHTQNEIYLAITLKSQEMGPCLPPAFTSPPTPTGRFTDLLPAFLPRNLISNRKKAIPSSGNTLLPHTTALLWALESQGKCDHRSLSWATKYQVAPHSPHRVTQVQFCTSCFLGWIIFLAVGCNG